MSILKEIYDILKKINEIPQEICEILKEILKILKEMHVLALSPSRQRRAAAVFFLWAPPQKMSIFSYKNRFFVQNFDFLPQNFFS